MQFHSFVPRTSLVFGEKTKQLQGAVRLACPPLFLANQCCDTNSPYTITVLPSYHIPHARLLAKRILDAISYILSGGRNEDQICDLMGSDCRGSINRHLKRASAKCNSWAMELVRAISEMHVSIMLPTLQKTFLKKDKFQYNWKNFLLLVGDYYDALETLPGTSVITNEHQLEFVHIRLAHAGFSLGP